jgi:hypothetical protein
VKVLYVENFEDASSKSLIGSWKAKFKVEILTFTEEECNTILAELKKSSLCFPESRRRFNEQNLGFLQLL